MKTEEEKRKIRAKKGHSENAVGLDMLLPVIDPITRGTFERKKILEKESIIFENLSPITKPTLWGKIKNIFKEWKRKLMG